MKVLGKPELDNSVKYYELELLLENFGVAKNNAEVASLRSNKLSTIDD
jgi:hypothetical protein